MEDHDDACNDEWLTDEPYIIDDKLVERVRLRSGGGQITIQVAGDTRIDRLDLDFLDRSGKDTTLVVGELNPSAGRPSRLRIGSITGDGSSSSINSLSIGGAAIL